MTVVIKAEGLSKHYRLGKSVDPSRTIREAFSEAARDAVRSVGEIVGRRDTQPDRREFWALRDVSFEVARGEAIGLIGGNGAGKSTLLKLLSRITSPTSGRAEIRGRVGSLLEVGTGFHPDLTGRENTFLNGAILGMSKSEVARKFDEIVAFAEVERFIDTPVKKYSSGMYLRLAFAVAAHLESDVLLVDEVLAVGDAAFQRKCLGKMGAAAGEGRTVIFVSHNMGAVQSLCSRALWLRAGEVVADGPATQVVREYLRSARQMVIEQQWPELNSAPGNEKVRLRRAAVIAEGDSAPKAEITTRTPFRLEFEYWNLSEGARLSLSVHVNDEEGRCVFNVVPVTEQAWYGKAFPTGLYRDVCRIPADLMNNGTYSIELFLVHDDATIVHHETELLTFDVLDEPGLRGGFHGRWAGVVRPIVPWNTERLAGLPPHSRNGVTGG